LADKTGKDPREIYAWNSKSRALMLAYYQEMGKEGGGIMDKIKGRFRK